MASQADIAQSRPPLAARVVDALTGPNAFAYAVVLPALLLRLAYTIVPLSQTIWLSFTNKSITNPGEFVGLANWRFLQRDETLLTSLGFTLTYTIVSVALEVAFGLLFALLLMQNLRGKWLSNFIMLLPWVMAPLLAPTVWKIMLYEEGGVLNGLLLGWGIADRPVPWLSDAGTARVSVIMLTVWKNVSWVTLIFMAGLAAIPRELQEAAVACPDRVVRLQS